jgi:hypothetical protein
VRTGRTGSLGADIEETCKQEFSLRGHKSASSPLQKWLDCLFGRFGKNCCGDYCKLYAAPQLQKPTLVSSASRFLADFRVAQSAEIRMCSSIDFLQPLLAKEEFCYSQPGIEIEPLD